MRTEEAVLKLLAKYEIRKEIPAGVRVKMLESKKRIHDEIIVKRGGSVNRERGMYMLKNTMIMASAAAVAVIMIGSLFLITGGFYGKQKESGIITAKAVFVTGDVEVKRGEISLKLKPGDAVQKGDVIVTGANSTASLQIDNTGIVTVTPDTECSFSGISSNGVTEMSLREGSVYSNLKKLSPGQMYRVKTLTYTASVRGTEFMSTAGKSGSDVRVLAGVVNVASAKSSVDVEKESGASVKDSGEVTGYSLNRLDILELKKYSLYKYIDELEKKNDSSLEQELKDINKQIADIVAEIAAIKAADPKPAALSPLDRLRKMGKPLTMIYLRDGSQIAGSVSGQSGGKLRLDTGDGVIKIPVNDIIRRMPIK